MQVQPVRNQTFDNQQHFKGFVGGGLRQYIICRASRECDKYKKIHSFWGDSKSVIEAGTKQIEAKWNLLLQIFEEKAKLLHKDSQINLFGQNKECQNFVYSIEVSNRNFRGSIHLFNVENTHSNGIIISNIGYNEFTKKALELSPEEIESKIFENANSTFEHDLGYHIGTTTHNDVIDFLAGFKRYVTERGLTSELPRIEQKQKYWENIK